MNAGDFSDCDALLDEHIVFEFPGNAPLEGKRRTLLFLHALLRKFPGLTFTVSETIIEGDRACAVWSNKGRDTGGRPYENRGVTLFRFSGDRIVFMSDYFKDTSFTG